MSQSLPSQAHGNGHPVPETSIASLDDGLRYRGYSIEELVEQSNFMESAFLIVHGNLPSHEQLADMQAILSEASVLEPDLLAWLERIPLNAPPVDVLRTAVNLIALADGHDDESHPAAVWDSLQRLLAQLPLVIASRNRIAHGLDLLEARDDLSYAGNLLWLLTGREPSPTAERACNAFLILSAEHEFAPSTYVARVVASTRSDFHSAIIAGLCAIKGVWHGGPGRQIIDILEAVGQPEAAPAIVRAVLQQYERLPGFWHRVYRTSDPRAELLTPFCHQLAEETDRPNLEETAAAIEGAVWEEQQILPSLDWPAARLLHYLGLDADLFVPLFVISRMVGWAAHYIEQQQSPQPIRPRGTYAGPPDREFETLDERG
ncbi:MAG: citrate synthase [Candidatus Saccharimonas sp.]|nr:citrate synthase [Planctomycetaceae bacterium]